MTTDLQQAGDADPEWVEWIKRYRAEPGDMVVVKTSHKLTRPQLELLRSQTKKAFPDQRVLLLLPGVDIEIVGRDETISVDQRV